MGHSFAEKPTLQSLTHFLADHASSPTISLLLSAGLMAALAGDTSFGQDSQGPLTIVKSTIYIKTNHAVANLLPGGRNTPFTGIPVAEMLGADSVDVMLEDIVIPGLNQPAAGDIELILLNERNVEPFEFDGQIYDYYYTLNPRKRSFGTLTVVQTSPDDRGPGFDGVYMRTILIDLIATLVPRDGRRSIEQEATITVASPLPIPFSFDPWENLIQKYGLVGDETASWHTNKTETERNIFGLGFLQIPLGGRSPVDSVGAHAMGGNKEMGIIIPNIDRDMCPDDAEKMVPGKAGCGDSDVDENGDALPDFYESTLLPQASRRGRGLRLSYDADSGEISVNVPEGERLIAVTINSASGIFDQASPRYLDGPMDKHSDVNIFKAVFGHTFGSVNFGPVAATGLSRELVLGDVTARALLDDYANVGGLALEYVGR